MNKIGHKIIHLDCVDSTNNYIANLVKEDKIEHGTVILADVQTNGRGQRGTIWQTQPHQNLIFSVYVQFSSFSAQNQSAINHWVSLSVCDLLEKIGINSSIKWPNDILTNNGKIAGILIETSLANNSIKYGIIGVGLNVNQIDFSGFKATSIQLEKGESYRVKEVAGFLMNALNNRFAMLENEDFETLRLAYHSKMWKINQEVLFLRNGQEEKGTIIGTDNNGLLVMNINGEKAFFDLKEIQFIV